VRETEQLMEPGRSRSFRKERLRDGPGAVGGNEPGRVILWLMAVVLGFFAFSLRMVDLGRSWDIFVDEITYLGLSKSVAGGAGITLGNGPFYLHPPGLFFLEAAYLKLFGISGGLIGQIYEVRYLNITLAALTAFAIFWLGRALAGWLAGVTAGAVFALEPFAMKMNSRNYLDTAAMLWVVLGYCVALSAVMDDEREKRLWKSVLAGFLFGLAILCKDVTSLVTLIPLFVCCLMGWCLPRAHAALAGIVAVLTYAPYPLVIYLRGDWADFVYQKSLGASRLAGLIHMTGFNKAGAPSFVETILDKLGQFATTYALFGLGALCVAALVVFGAARVPGIRLFVLWVASSYALLAFIVFQGALEEQFFYYLIVPAILSTAVGFWTLGVPQALGGRLGSAVRAGAIVAAAAFALWSGYVWYEIHTVPDNGHERVVSYVRNEVPKSANVGSTSDIQQYLLKGRSSGVYGSIEELRRNDVRYVIFSSYLVNEGYGQASPEFYEQVKEDGRLVYGFRDRSFGLLGVYKLPAWQDANAETAGAKPREG
jgi:4-amino-4-deoxy-L-arabinose transferase-like glycosyltransferase